jgi:hypothetical protein
MGTPVQSSQIPDAVLGVVRAPPAAYHRGRILRAYVDRKFFRANKICRSSGRGLVSGQSVWASAI